MIEENYISILELLMLPLFILILFICAKFYEISKLKKSSNGYYNFFSLGLLAKLLGGTSFALIYIYYYGGGDTTSYHKGGLAFTNLFWQDINLFIKVYFSEPSKELYTLFNSETKYPPSYMYYDLKTLFVIKFITPLMIVTNKSYLYTTILMSIISYSGGWKIYKLFNFLFKNSNLYIALSFLFFPSILFWGSGISKDSITLMASSWLIYELFSISFNRKKLIIRFLIIIIAVYIILGIKPYIVYALFPAFFLWFVLNYINKSNSLFIKFILVNITLVIFALGLYFSFNEVLMEIESMLTEAAIKQYDLKQDYYGGSSFDIGTFEPNIMSALSKFPIAVYYGIFGPLLWDAENIVVFISALENTILLILFIRLLLKMNLISIYKKIKENNILVFFIFYSIMFSFLVGLSTANFGALVRFKIPYLSYILISFLLLSRSNSFKKIE